MARNTQNQRSEENGIWFTVKPQPLIYIPYTPLFSILPGPLDSYRENRANMEPNNAQERHGVKISPKVCTSQASLAGPGEYGNPGVAPSFGHPPEPKQGGFV